jgi:hypothetical protein
VRPKVVQELPGHGAIGMTLDTYSHVAPDTPGRVGEPHVEHPLANPEVRSLGVQSVASVLHAALKGGETTSGRLARIPRNAASVGVRRERLLSNCWSPRRRLRPRKSGRRSSTRGGRATLRAGLAAMIGVIALALLVCLLVLALALFVPRRRRRVQGWEARSEEPEHRRTPSGAAGSRGNHESGENGRDR